MMILAHHEAGALPDALFAGLLHPLTSPVHLLPLLGLGLLAGFQRPRVARWVLLALPVGLFTGTVLSSTFGGHAWTPLLSILAFSFLAIGAALSSLGSLPVLTIVGTSLGITVGLQIGLGLPATVSAVPFGLGVASTGIVLTAMTVAVATRNAMRADRAAVHR